MIHPLLITLELLAAHIDDDTAVAAFTLLEVVNVVALGNNPLITVVLATVAVAELWWFTTDRFNSDDTPYLSPLIHATRRRVNAVKAALTRAMTAALA